MTEIAEDGHRSSYYKDGEIHVNVLGQPEGKAPRCDGQTKTLLDIHERHKTHEKEQCRASEKRT